MEEEGGSQEPVISIDERENNAERKEKKRN